ncbi:MAG: hydrogenase expression/formation protein HypE [Planctomycetes bacterium]|nr:hydrogenase expression/formation protein HypE [Planctomycetota bacterium]
MSPTPDPILLAHGAGGRATSRLVQECFVPALDNPFLRTLTDAAVLPALPPGRPALTTDGFVVDPVVFPGGDLGYLSVCGTVNDLAVSGAVPMFLTWALILEEGLDRALLEQVVAGAARAAREANVLLVAGDTKVVPRGRGDKVFAVSTGLGVVPPGRELGDHRVAPGDVVISSGTLGDHGAVVLACRHGLDSELRSCVAPLRALAAAALASGADVHTMHDPTRGGVATVCHETAVRAGCRIELDERAVPVRRETIAVCELLGLDPLYLACEGRLLLWVAAGQAELVLAALRATPGGEGATVIGAVTGRGQEQAPLVLRTRSGAGRPLDLLSGMDLPRIC